jgi:hypothetical protein
MSIGTVGFGQGWTNDFVQAGFAWLFCRFLSSYVLYPYIDMAWVWIHLFHSLLVLFLRLYYFSPLRPVFLSIINLRLWTCTSPIGRPALRRMTK